MTLIRNFLKAGNTGSLLLLIAVLFSLFIANSPWGLHFEQILSLPFGWSGSVVDLKYPLLAWINDGLMAIFFLLVGLEIKRELLKGELSSTQKAILPVFAALGGMLIPALFYFLFNQKTETAAGWGIPMATDIAFALAVISLLSKRVPASLKIFLAALAIVDDLGAILVIAAFYSGAIHWLSLLYAGIVLALLILFNRMGLRSLAWYLVPGLFLWYFIHHSGIHATIAGVLLALSIPLTTKKGPSPLEKLEHALINPVHLLIMPIFALANTNIRFENSMLEQLGSPLSLGIISGLFLGKTVGVSLFSYLAVRLGLASLPGGSRWSHIFGLGMLAGIGFTMSIFIAMLSFDQPLTISTAKFAVLIASLLSGLSGYLYLKSIGKRAS